MIVLCHLLTAGTTDEELVEEIHSGYQGKVVVGHDLEQYQ